MASPQVLLSTLFANVASTLGTSEEVVILLTSLLLGYPIGLLHRYSLYGKRPSYQHLFFALSGLAIGYLNYQWDVLHSLLTVIVTYSILYIAGGTITSVLLVMLYTMTYLIFAYYVTSSDVYNIKWSMAQCVLTLKLIGLAFDIYDGKKSKDKQSVSMRKAAVDSTPSFMEVMAYTYFPAGFLVGPQFPIKRYLDFVAGKYGRGRSVPESIWPGYRRGLLGILYLAIFQVGTTCLPNEYLLSQHFETLPFYMRCFYLGLWGKVVLYKYIACWLMSEGACILTGLAYNGIDEAKRTKWDGCANVNLSVYEKATKFEHIIQSFNINTNNWAAQYIYKRMKFLGSRQLSQLATLGFLALWHGIYSGYYMCFFLELIITCMEKDLTTIVAKNQAFSNFFNRPVLKPIKLIFLKIVVLVLMGYALVPFVLLTYDRWISVYKSVYFFGHVMFMPWPFLAPLVKYILIPKRPTIVHVIRKSSSLSVPNITKLNQHASTERIKKYY